MPGLVPGIHVFLWRQDVDGRDKAGHDGPPLVARRINTQVSICDIDIYSFTSFRSRYFDTVKISLDALFRRL